MNPQVAFLLSKAIESIHSSNLDTAELYLAQALKIQSNNSEAIRLYGVISALKGNYLDAIKLFDQAIEISSQSAVTYSNKGNALVEIGRFEDALSCYDRAISLQPRYHEAYNNKGNALQEIGRFEDALSCYDRAISLQPRYFEAYNNKGNTLEGIGKYKEAHDYYDQVIQRQPNNLDALNGKAFTFKKQKDYGKSIELFDRVLIFNKLSIDAWLGKGMALAEMNQLANARECFMCGLQIKPDHAKINNNLAQLELTEKNFPQGWRHYKYRLQLPELKVKNQKLTKKVWQGKKENKNLYIWAEQGIGDQILYASIFKNLEEYPQKKIVSLESKLLKVFTRSFPNFVFIDKGDPPPEHSYDEQIPIGSLPSFFRNSLEDFKGMQYPYLLDDAKKTQSIKARLNLNNSIICGISWGSINKRVGDDKSIPIHALYPILRISTIKFVNLQYGSVTDSLLKAKKDVGKEIINIDEIDLFNDVDSALSIIAACDIVITSSNTTAHLAGALGKETLLLVPYSVGKFWYWHVIDGKSIWYPSIRVFEQRSQCDWSIPINEVKQYLERRFE